MPLVAGAIIGGNTLATLEDRAAELGRELGRERALRALHEVADPEFPISIVDLGLVYGVEVEDETVHVRLTFTATACPCMDFIKWDVRERLLEEAGFEDVRIEEVWDPPWTAERITDRGREVLQEAGVAV